MGTIGHERVVWGWAGCGRCRADGVDEVAEGLSQKRAKRFERLAISLSSLAAASPPALTSWQRQPLLLSPASTTSTTMTTIRSLQDM